MKSGIIFFVAWSMAATGMAQFPITNVPLHKPFIGMGYSPFQGNESPNYDTYPTIEQIAYDLTNALTYLAGEITTYSMDGPQSNIPGLCAQYNIKCYPCAFLNADYPADSTNQLNALIAVANSNLPTTLGLVVGSEPITMGDYTAQMVINSINYVRAGTHTNFPVGTREAPFNLYNYPSVVSNCDFVMADIYAYWGQVPIDQAAEWTIQQWQEMTNTFPGKKIIIGEVNWPSGGTNPDFSNPSVMPSVTNQAIFLSQFVPLANSNGIEYFIFEYRDELWKIQDGYGSVEQNWGVVDTNSDKKQSLLYFLSENFWLNISSTNSVLGSQITINTYEGDPYYLYATGNILDGWGVPALGFFGAAGTNQTTIAVTNLDQPGPVFWRAEQGF